LWAYVFGEFQVQNSAALDLDVFDPVPEHLRNEVGPTETLLAEPEEQPAGLAPEEQTAGRGLAVIILGAALLGSLFYAWVIYAVLT
jgi:hypothetical protein